MCAKSTRTCVATLYRSLDVICGKVPEYVRSPWQIPLLFYGKTPGRRTGGGGRFCTKTRGLCMCANKWVRKRFLLNVFELFSLSKCFHQMTKSPTTIHHMCGKCFMRWTFMTGGVLFLKCISSFSIPLHSFSHWHCRNLFGLSPSDLKIKMQICIFDIKSPRNLYRPVGKEVPRCCAHLINVL